MSSAKSINDYDHLISPKNEDIYKKGGRDECLKMLRNIEEHKGYGENRNFLYIESTGLSAHNKFGTCSIREVYFAIKHRIPEEKELIRQLYWRDFYTYITYHNPQVFGQAYRTEFDDITWSQSTNDFEKWCTGQTGFPVVDAAMRQLNQTGYLHNRARLIVSSFLIKDLMINWQWGEKYFAQKLVDYDPAVNNGNWQWVASTGTDMQPYFRIFNPWTQQEKFDAECEYIKKWVPELKDIDTKTIHNWYKSDKQIKGYPRPMVDHSVQREKVKDLYKKAKS
jgi:deoxyribodipyrimidine photo-lyase